MSLCRTAQNALFAVRKSPQMHIALIYRLLKTHSERMLIMPSFTRFTCSNCRPRPDISPTLLFLRDADVLSLRADECLNLIALQAQNSKVTHMMLVVRGSRTAEITEQIQNGVLCNSGHSTSCVYGGSFY